MRTLTGDHAYCRNEELLDIVADIYVEDIVWRH